MKKIALLAILLSLDSFAAEAQTYFGPATVIYPTTPGDCVKIDNTLGGGYLADAGAPCGAGGGGVSSVGLSLPGIFAVTGSPVTTAGTLTATLNTQSANTVFSGPTSGSAAGPTFRALVAADIPSLAATYLPLSGGTMAGVVNIPANDLSLTGSSSGASVLNAPATGGGTLTLPTGTGTIAALNLAQIFTAQQTNQGASGTSPGWYAQITGDANARVRVGLNVNDVASIGFGAGSTTRDLFLERAAAATLRLGTQDVASPVAQIFNVQSVVTGTTDGAGAIWKFQDSAGTGAGASGGFEFDVHLPGSTGTSQNAASSAWAISGTTGVTTILGATVTGSTVPNNGIYLAAANTLGLSANAAKRWTVSNTGFLSQSATGVGLAPGTISCSGPGFFSQSDSTTGFSASATGNERACIIVAGTETLSVLANEVIDAASGAASFSPLLLNGTVFTGGSATSTFPTMFVQPSGTTAATTWSTSGTGFGMNLASGFSGNFLDFHLGGAASVFLVNSAGAISAGNINVNSASIPVQGMFNSSGSLGFSASSTIQFLISSSLRANNATGPLLPNSAASATAPTFNPNRSDVKAGIGADAAGDVSIIADNATVATEMIRVTGTTVAMPTIAASSAAQTGTVCWTTGTGNLTVDTTTTCLLSLEETKNIQADIDPMQAIAEEMKLKPFWFSYKPGTNQADHAVHAGLGAHQVESVDKRLVGYDPKGKLQGVRYADSVTSLNVAAIKGLQSEILSLKVANDNLQKRVAKLERHR